MPDRNVLFGVGLGAWNGADAVTAAESVKLITQADRDGGFIYRSTDDTPAAEALARWATEIVPAVRAAIAK